MQPEDLERLDTPPLDAPLEAPMFAPPAVPERDPFWGYYDLLLVLGLLFAFILVVVFATGVIMRFHPGLSPTRPEIALPFQFAVYAVIYLAILIPFKLRYDRPVLSSLGWRSTNVNLLGVGVAGILLAIGLNVLATLIHTPQVATPFEDLVTTPFWIALLAFTAVVAGPLFEEMMFRGFLQPLFSRTFGTVLGILLTALLFGGLHASEYKYAWQYVAAISIVGIVLGTLRARTNSIIPGTVMHGCFNLVSVVSLVNEKILHHK